MQNKVYIAEVGIPTKQSYFCPDVGSPRVFGDRRTVKVVLVEKTLNPKIVKELITGMKIPIVPYHYEEYFYRHIFDSRMQRIQNIYFPDHIEYKNENLFQPYPLCIYADMKKYPFDLQIILKEAKLEDLRNYISAHQDIHQYADELNEFYEQGKEKLETFLNQLRDEKKEQKEYKSLMKQIKTNRKHV